ncbi:fumarylacetoacetase [Sphaerotilus sp.]|uniref:fumarylacetoacetase n=1 Tax=Sphaerotilus sp. TaxID=2093942 RepID=UPI00286DEF38|nr:fumarylacetoacetase [Sphaerotilus sp.]
MNPNTHLDATHDLALCSWVASANDGATDFPIQNLPYARARRAGTDEPWRIMVAIGDQALDLAAAVLAAEHTDAQTAALAPLVQGDLNAFMTRGPADWQLVRESLSRALTMGSPAERALAPCLIAQSALEFALPCTIGDYTDFYTGIHHATTVGKLFRPDNPLLPNYQWVPIGYHGRASSIGVSGQTVRRPMGQTKAPDSDSPQFGPCKRLDFELELGLVIGTGNALGERIDMAQAEAALFGMVLLNDWSARDVQAWEYQPLGPFLSKNFATTISPWIVTMAALAPFRLPFTRPAGDPQPLPYLDSAANRAAGAIDVQLSVWIETAQMSASKASAVRLSSSNFSEAAYWTATQLVAHHTAGGCNLQAGDLLGTGTLSGPAPDQAGSLLELSMGGKTPITLPNGEQRTFLADGDGVILKGRCSAVGAVALGFGECRGTVLPALAG